MRRFIEKCERRRSCARYTHRQRARAHERRSDFVVAFYKRSAVRLVQFIAYRAQRVGIARGECAEREHGARQRIHAVGARISIGQRRAGFLSFEREIGRGERAIYAARFAAHVLHSAAFGHDARGSAAEQRGQNVVGMPVEPRAYFEHAPLRENISAQRVCGDHSAHYTRRAAAQPARLRNIAVRAYRHVSIRTTGESENRVHCLIYKVGLVARRGNVAFKRKSVALRRRYRMIQFVRQPQAVEPAAEIRARRAYFYGYFFHDLLIRYGIPSRYRAVASYS